VTGPTVFCSSCLDSPTPVILTWLGGFGLGAKLSIRHGHCRPCLMSKSMTWAWSFPSNDCTKYQPLIYGAGDKFWHQAHSIEKPQSNTVIFFQVIGTIEIMRQVDIVSMGHSFETCSASDSVRYAANQCIGMGPTVDASSQRRDKQ
jgi:hypothetical protein